MIGTNSPLRHLLGLLFLASGAASAWGSLQSYDVAIDQDAAAGLSAVARLTAPVVFTGSNRAHFNFGVVPGDATLEFILQGDPVREGNDGYLAVGANTRSNLRYEQWSNTGQLGFTQLGVVDYLFSPAVPSPTEPVHVAFVWNATARTMRLYWNGSVAGTSSGVDTAFAMPTGQGYLGANPANTENMIGTIHRLTVYDRAIPDEAIQRHADAYRDIVPPPVIAWFKADPTVVFTPGSATLSWEVQNATDLTLNGADVTGVSARTIAPAVTALYTLIAANAGGRVTNQVTVHVNPAPAIEQFAASPSHVVPATPVTLSWEVRFGLEFSIEPDIGDVGPQTTDGIGTRTVLPTHSTTYILTATSLFGTNTARVDVHLVHPASHCVISEFMADDDSTLADEDREFSGWIEIHNPTSAARNLAGYSLTDDPEDPVRWSFPSLSLGPGGYCVVFASGKDRRSPAGPLHANFRLNNQGEYLALVGPGPVVLHEFAPAFPPQRPDISYGVLAADVSLAQAMGVPTPGTENDETLPPPGTVVLSPAGGMFVDSLQVTLIAPDEASTIRFTLDGTQPSATHGTVYTAPLILTQTTRIRTVAIRDDRVSPTSGAGYIQLAPELTDYTSSLPILVIENFGAGTIPQKGWSGDGSGIHQVPRQAAVWATFEPLDGRSALSDPPRMLSAIGIRGRGSFSVTWRQKPYAVQAVNENGDDADVAPLGMPPHSDWILYFPDADDNKDPTLLFNTFAYELSRNTGHYAVRFRWVEAFVHENGGKLRLADRRGVYALIESVARGPDRLDFHRLSPDGTAGGWLLNINRMDPEPDSGWPAPNGATQPWFFHTAGPNRLLETPANTRVLGDDLPQQSNGFLNFDVPSGYTITLEQKAAIEQWFKQFEDVLYDPSRWRDPTTGYRHYIDERDFVDYFILNVLTRNGDGLLISLFPWKGDDGRLRIGPAWDYNYNSYYVSGGPSGSLRHRADQLWYPRLFNDPDFAQSLVDRWWDLRQGPLRNTALEAIIDRQSAEITPDKALLNGLPSTAEWANRLTRMKSWLADRANWIDSNYLRPPSFNLNGGAVPDGFPVVLTGTGGILYYTTDRSDPRASGGGLASTAGIYRNPIPLHAPARIQARLRNGDIWSGLAVADFTTPQDLAKLTLTEIMYHPPAGEADSGDDLEFLELKNTGAQPLDVGGCAFTTGIEFAFPAGTVLHPGQLCVLARNAAAFARHYPATPAAGTYRGKLENSGETLQLTASDGAPVLAITYDDRAPWPVLADGAGPSLQRRNASDNDSAPTAWVAAAPSPGTDYVPGPAPVVRSQPASQTLVAGQTASLVLGIDSVLPWQCQWQLNGVALPAAIAATFDLPDAQPEHTGTYDAIVFNNHGAVLSEPASLTVLADRDADGTPDDWETHHGLNPDDPRDRSLDADTDGMSNEQEYVAGTDPGDPSSCLKLQAVLLGSELSLRFDAVAHRAYAVEYTDLPALAPWIPLVTLEAQNANRAETVTDPAHRTCRFYRVLIPRRP